MTCKASIPFYMTMTSQRLLPVPRRRWALSCHWWPNPSSRCCQPYRVWLRRRLKSQVNVVKTALATLSARIARLAPRSKPAEHGLTPWGADGLRGGRGAVTVTLAVEAAVLPLSPTTLQITVMGLGTHGLRECRRQSGTCGPIRRCTVAVGARTILGLERRRDGRGIPGEDQRRFAEQLIVGGWIESMMGRPV